MRRRKTLTVSENVALETKSAKAKHSGNKKQAPALTGKDLNSSNTKPCSRQIQGQSKSGSISSKRQSISSKKCHRSPPVSSGEMTSDYGVTPGETVDETVLDESETASNNCVLPTKDGRLPAIGESPPACSRVFPVPLSTQLSEEVKHFIIRCNAHYHTPSQVVREIEASYGIKIRRQDVEYYHPAKVRGKNLAKRYRLLFEQERRSYQQNLESTSLATPVGRLAILEDLCESAREKGDDKMVLACVEKAERLYPSHNGFSMLLDIMAQGTTLTTDQVEELGQYLLTLLPLSNEQLKEHCQRIKVATATNTPAPPNTSTPPNTSSPTNTPNLSMENDVE